MSETVKEAVSSWYQAIDMLSRDNWQLPKTLSLKSFQKQFRTSYEHLIINGGEIYEKANGDKLKRDVNDFTRGIANILIGILKEISVKTKTLQFKNTIIELRFNFYVSEAITKCLNEL